MRFLLYALIILYIVSPYDLLPDFFPGVGWTDDLIILGLLGWYHFVYRKGTGGERWRSRGPGASTGSREKSWDEKGGSERKQSPHEVLGVAPDASAEEIRTAYRRLVNQYHPDKVAHLGEEFRLLAEKRFKEIQQAYQEVRSREP